MDTIALDADVNDLNKIETTLKSIFLHNQHVEIHIINFNIPHESLHVDYEEKLI